MSSNAAEYLTSLQQLGISQNNPSQISDFETTPCPYDMFNDNWEGYTRNTIFDLSTEITRELQTLYMVGNRNKNKNRKITAEKAYYILVNTVIKYVWLQTMKLYVTNINSFFSKTPVKMQTIINITKMRLIPLK